MWPKTRSPVWFGGRGRLLKILVSFKKCSIDQNFINFCEKSMLRWETHLHQLRDYILLFLLLSFSLILINLNSNPQVRWLHGFSLNLIGNLQNTMHFWGKVRQLENENDELRSRVADLTYKNSLMQEAYLSNIRLRNLLKYKKSSSFKLVTAVVIGQNYHGFSHALLINSGKKQGLEEKLPVLSSDGLVGKIALIGSHYAVVQPLDDVNFRVSAMIQRNRVVGIFTPGKSGKYFLNYVPIQSNVKKGDVVVTSGYSNVFPKGIKIGVVTQVGAAKNKLFKKIEVTPGVQTERVENVFVVLKKAR
ncbi:MAG TPA: rod shape-determining protein MreC [Bacteroidetes bacterium]|nr:rod shape-determining protein MreC [Bacteroidota bacterium]HDZ11038.1 rod shape-determining protein MreC [Bacteroidota bacterium]